MNWPKTISEYEMRSRKKEWSVAGYRIVVEWDWFGEEACVKVCKVLNRHGGYRVLVRYDWLDGRWTLGFLHQYDHEVG